MAVGVRNPNILALILALCLLATASAKVFFEERFHGINISPFLHDSVYLCIYMCIYARRLVLAGSSGELGFLRF